MNSKVGFIGAGRIAQALAGGIATSLPDTQFVVVDPNPDAVTKFRARLRTSRRSLCGSMIRSELDGSQSASNHLNPVLLAINDDDQVITVETSQQVFDCCDLIFLAVKPQFAPAALTNLSPKTDQSQLLVSVMAGISIARVQQLTQCSRVIRAMPNTPCLVGEGASAITCSELVSLSELESVRLIFQSVGTVEIVAESLLDAVTGLSGSGPAYVFSFVESLIRGGIAVGLPPEVADRLARQTLFGAATMLTKTNVSPEELRNHVTSPGGTTMAGLDQLRQQGFDSAIVRAVEKATERSRELGSH